MKDSKNHVRKKTLSQCLLRQIIATEVKVEMSPWPDHVFDADYDLMPLGEVETYIQAHGHLPGVPSASDVADNGVALGNMQATLLQKIEELTLYLIEMKNENKELKERVAALEW